MNKDKVEGMCRAAGLRPEERRTVRGYDLFLADGFSAPPHLAFNRFGVEPNEFPFGAFVTFWWLMKGEDRLFVANPIFFDAFHNPELDQTDKKRSRINRAVNEADKFLRNLGKAKEMNLNA